MTDVSDATRSPHRSRSPRPFTGRTHVGTVRLDRGLQPEAAQDLHPPLVQRCCSRVERATAVPFDEHVRCAGHAKSADVVRPTSFAQTTRGTA